MSYRIHEHKPPKPRREVDDVTTPMKLYIHNGVSSDFAFPCYYQEIHKPVPMRPHDRHWHDHIGWPAPSHPGHSCQLWIPEHGCRLPGHPECHPHCRHYVDLSTLTPIHLTSSEEGYTTVSVAWVTAPTGITVTAWIDEEEDWVVHVNVDCKDPNAKEKPQTYKMTVFANAPAANGKPARRDIVALAELVVLPSAYVA